MPQEDKLREILDDVWAKGVAFGVGDNEQLSKYVIDQALAAIQKDYIRKDQVRVDGEKLANIQLPYPATFTMASPLGKVDKITLSYEAAYAIAERIKEVIL